jgi:hypothetical protein
MRRELVVQLVLTALALLLLMIIIFAGNSSYVEELPPGISGPIPTLTAPDARPARVRGETSYDAPRGARPAGPETAYTAAAPVAAPAATPAAARTQPPPARQQSNPPRQR